jgi:hypothetical protein
MYYPSLFLKSFPVPISALQHTIELKGRKNIKSSLKYKIYYIFVIHYTYTKLYENKRDFIIEKQLARHFV